MYSYSTSHDKLPTFLNNFFVASMTNLCEQTSVQYTIGNKETSVTGILPYSIPYHRNIDTLRLQTILLREEPNTQ